MKGAGSKTVAGSEAGEKPKTICAGHATPPRLPVVQTHVSLQQKKWDAAEPNGSLGNFFEGVENSVGAGRERVISKGPESSFEQRPKVIVEDDERRPKVIVVEDDVLLRRMVSDALRSEGSQVLEAATAYEAFLLFKSDRDVGVVISDRRVIGVMKDDALVGMPLSDYLRHCGYRVLEAANADEALLLLQKPGIQADVVMTDVGGSGAMIGFKLTQRVHTFLASWGLGDWLLGIGRCLRAEYEALDVPGPLPPRLAALVNNTEATVKGVTAGRPALRAARVHGFLRRLVTGNHPGDRMIAKSGNG
jgi:CheY-like chemotaxis protein